MSLVEINTSLKELEEKRKYLLDKQRKSELRPFKKDRNDLQKRKYDQKQFSYNQEPVKKIHINNEQISDNNDRNQNNQKVRLQSTIVVNNAQNIEDNSQQQKIQGKNNVRDRNMFGSILSHLKKAKIVLEKEQTTIKKQELATQKASGKNQQELQRLKQQILDKKNENLKKIQEERIQTQKDLIKVNHQIMYNKIYKHFMQLQNFIQTKQEPLIFWLPAKIDEKIQALLLDSKNILNTQQEEMQKKAEIELQKLIDKFELDQQQKIEKSIKNLQHVEDQDQHKDSQSEQRCEKQEMPDQEIEDIIN